MVQKNSSILENRSVCYETLQLDAASSNVATIAFTTLNLLNLFFASCWTDAK